MDAVSFKSILDQAFDIYVAFNQNGDISYMNQSGREELGVTEADCTNINLSVFLESSTDNTEYANSQVIFDGEIRETMIYRKNLTCFPAFIRCTELDDDFFHYLIVLRNRSNEIALEKRCETIQEEAASAAKVKDEFVANVTHELRTPVNGILGNTRILLDKEHDIDNLNTLHTIETGCNVMHNLINNILDFSKLEAGKFTLENREFEFSNVIDFVKSNHLPKMNEKGLEFIINLSSDIPKRIIGDELRIGQILNNLLSNAIKFTSVGSVTLQALKTAQKNNRIELFFMVIDTGIGMEKGDLDKLFKSFSQVDASITRQYGGTGLGLNISKQLVDLMGGTITVNSEKGKGSMFSFSIWVDVPEEEAKQNLVFDAKPDQEQIHQIFENNSISDTLDFGSADNLKEIQRLMEKLILCIEMSNWEKAENFSESLKQMTSQAPKEIKTSFLRLKMAVQKADYDKSVEAYNNAKEALPFNE